MVRVEHVKSTRDGTAAVLSGHVPCDCADAQRYLRRPARYCRFPSSTRSTPRPQA